MIKNLLGIVGITLFFLFILIIIKIFDISYPLSIVTTTKSTELSVVGEGKTDVVPDTAYVDAGIEVNNASSVTDAQKTIDEIGNKIIDAMKSLGISKSDIKTSNYSINPNYVYEIGQNRISGYNANETISIKIKNISLVSKVIDESTKAGANNVQGARFTVDDPQKYRELARNLAISNAKEQAQKLANSLGIKLGKIVNIVESTPTESFPVFTASEGRSLGGAAPVIEPGTQAITSEVTLYFEKR